MVLVSAPAADADTATRQLRAKLANVTKQRDRWEARAVLARAERDVARADARDVRAALASGLPVQVTAVAREGRVSGLRDAVFEPIRLAWPCGSTLFQGTALWSLDVDLAYLDLAGDALVRRDCSA